MTQYASDDSEPTETSLQPVDAEVLTESSAETPAEASAETPATGREYQNDFLSDVTQIYLNEIGAKSFSSRLASAIAQIEPDVTHLAEAASSAPVGK